MKTMRTFALAMIGGAALTMTSCQKQPTANISADKTDVEIKETVKFSNTSTDADNYEWDFGDGQKSTEESPSYSWSSAGSYSVKMTAFSKNGKKSDEASISIKVNEINAKFVGTYSVSEDYTSELCGSGTDSYSITITAGSFGNKVHIINFADGFSSVEGTISGNTITIPPQYGLYHSGFGSTWDIVSGTGTLSGNKLTMSYTLDDFLYNYDCGLFDASLTATK